MGKAGDLLIKVRFAGIDGLSRVLETISGNSKQAGRALTDTNRALGKQKAELRDVQRQLSSASGNVTGLVERERTLEETIATTNRQLARRQKIVAANLRTERLTGVGRDLVASGRNDLFLAAAAAAPLMAVAKAGAQFQQYQNRMRVLGLGDEAVDDLTRFAKAMDVAGSSVNENMRYLLEAQGVFRETGEHTIGEQLKGAKEMAPLLAKMHAASQAMGKEISDDQERYFLRFVEQAGGLASSKVATQLTDGLFRALQSSGGNVQASDYQGFLAHAGIAGRHLSNRSMFADMEPIIGELHEQAAVGLQTAFKRATAITHNSSAASEFMRLGLWDKGKVTLNALGGVKKTNGNPLTSRAADLIQHDPVEFYRQIVLPAYDRGGIKTSEERSVENAKLFGGTGGNLFSLFDKQLSTILKSRAAFGKTQSLGKAYDQTNGSFDGKIAALKAAGTNFMVAASMKGGLLDNVTSLIKGATRALHSFTAWGEAHPRSFGWIGKIATDLLLLKVGLGVTKMAFGGLLQPAAKLWEIGSKIRAAGSIAGAFPGAAKGAKAAARGAGWLSRGSRAALSVVGSGAIQGAVAGYNLIRSGALKMAGGLRTGAVAGAGLLRSLALLAANGIASAAVSAFGLIRTAAIFLGQGFMRAGVMMLANPLVLIITGVAVAIGAAAYLIYSHWATIKGAFASALTYLSGLWVGFKAIGGHIISGLVDGIKSAFPGVAAIIQALGKMLPEPLRKLLGIHSPSRVFAEIGGHMMTGLTRGIVSGEAAPLLRTRRLASALAVAGAVPLAAPKMARPAVASALAASPVAQAFGPVSLVPAGLPALAERMAAHAATRIVVSARQPSGDIGGGRAARREPPPALPQVTIQIFGAQGQSEMAIGREVEAVLRRLGITAPSSRRASYRDDPDGADL